MKKSFAAIAVACLSVLLPLAPPGAARAAGAEGKGGAVVLRLQPDGELSGLPEAGRGREHFLAVTFDLEGKLYLLEESGQRLIELDPRGRYLRETGGFGYGAGTFRGATDIVQAGFELWVADPFAGRIVRFDRWLAPLDAITGADGGGGEDAFAFDRPVSVARAASGDLVVLERDRQEALLLDLEGRLIDRIGEYGDTGGGLVAPRRVEIAGDGRIAIADPGRRETVLFDRFGSFLRRLPWTLPGRGPLGLAWSDGRLWVCGEGGLAVYGAESAPRQLWPASLFGGPPEDVAAAPGRIAVAAGSTLRLFHVTGTDR